MEVLIIGVFPDVGKNVIKIYCNIHVLDKNIKL